MLFLNTEKRIVSEILIKIFPVESAPSLPFACDLKLLFKLNLLKKVPSPNTFYRIAHTFCLSFLHCSFYLPDKFFSEAAKKNSNKFFEILLIRLNQLFSTCSFLS